jgi:hypothetical protein
VILCWLFCVIPLVIVVELPLCKYERKLVWLCVIVLAVSTLLKKLEAYNGDVYCGRLPHECRN